MFKVGDLKDFIEKETECGIMLLNKNDEYICSSLLKNGMWDKHLYPVFSKYIKKGHCVVDIGANNGCHSLRFSKLVGETGHVHSIEPIEEIYLQLQYNTIRNNCYNVTTYNCGLCEKFKKIYMYPLELKQKYNFGGKSLKNLPLEKDYINQNEIIMLPLDEMKLKPNFIKIDVEHMELEVLKGAINTIKTYKPIILIELQEEDYEITCEYLKNTLNYTVKSVGGWDYLCIPLLN